MDASRKQLLHRAALEHRRALRRSAEIAGSDYPAILDLGATLLMHSIIESSELHRSCLLLDRSVRDELDAEHVAIGEGLRLLEDLMANEPGSPDLPLLSHALLQRMRQHLERDERVLFEPLRKMRVLTV